MAKVLKIYLFPLSLSLALPHPFLHLPFPVEPAGALPPEYLNIGGKFYQSHVYYYVRGDREDREFTGYLNYNIGTILIMRTLGLPNNMLNFSYKNIFYVNEG